MAKFLTPTENVPPVKKYRRDFSRCPRCNAPTKKAKAINSAESQFFLECTECNTYINTYIPQGHQEAVHRDSHRIIGNFGAYGTGKTTTSREEIFKHCFITPSANVLVGANVQSQYEQTIKRELEADLPVAFVAEYSTQKQYCDLLNGARIMYRPFDDADKLRSYNLTMAVAIESSEIKANAYHQLKTRLRNLSACTFETDPEGNPILDYDERGEGIPRVEHDWRRFIVESNPDSGWIRTDLLLVSDKITQHGTHSEGYDQSELVPDPGIASHIASTDVNRYLPPGYIQENSRNKPAWWVMRYLYGSFRYAEGLVYPQAIDHVVPAFPIPPHWQRLVAFDYGLRDDAVFIFAAVDPRNGIVYVYKEIRTNNMNIDELSKLYFEGIKDIPSGCLFGRPIIDPKSGSKRDYNKDTLSDLFLQKGISFKPGYISVDARIFRMNSYIAAEKVKIMDCCMGLIKEVKEYKFPQRTLENPNPKDKPEDKNNHGVNALEWIIMELPDDPRNVVNGVYNRFGQDLDNMTSLRQTMSHPLSDEEPDAFQDDQTAFGSEPFQYYF